MTITNAFATQSVQPVVSGEHDCREAVPSPSVTVVIATYNRSQPLCHAIRSVLAQTYTDWELIVVGDACTDDTEACVASFHDARIRFVNLAKRCGYQSGPNNCAMSIARGRIIAFLNHDDLYFPDHLATCIAELEASGADFVWSPIAGAFPKKSARLTTYPFEFKFGGVQAGPNYLPEVYCHPSSWVFRESLVRQIGPWKSPEETYLLPSQEWLFRAWRAGAVMRFVRRLTVLGVPPAGVVPGYSRRECPEHDLLVDWMQDGPRCREQILEEIAIGYAMEVAKHRLNPELNLLRRLVRRIAYRILPSLGIHPYCVAVALRSIRRGERRGDGIRQFNKVVGAE